PPFVLGTVRKSGVRTAPLRSTLIAPCCCTMKRRPLPSPEWTSSTGEAMPEVTTGRIVTLGSVARHGWDSAAKTSGAIHSPALRRHGAIGYLLHQVLREERFQALMVSQRITSSILRRRLQSACRNRRRSLPC